MSCPPSQPAYLPSDTPTYPSLPSDQPFKLTTRPEPAYSPTGLNLSTRTRAQPRTVPTRDPYAACRFLQLPAGACRCMPLSAYLPADPTRGETRRAPYPSRPPYPPLPRRSPYPSRPPYLPACLPSLPAFLPDQPAFQPSSPKVSGCRCRPVACRLPICRKEEGWRRMEGWSRCRPPSLPSLSSLPCLLSLPTLPVAVA